jgi:hypothetical protein
MVEEVKVAEEARARAAALAEEQKKQTKQEEK